MKPCVLELAAGIPAHFTPNLPIIHREVRGERGGKLKSLEIFLLLFHVPACRQGSLELLPRQNKGLVAYIKKLLSACANPPGLLPLLHPSDRHA